MNLIALALLSSLLQAEEYNLYLYQPDPMEKYRLHAPIQPLPQSVYGLGEFHARPRQRTPVNIEWYSNMLAGPTIAQEQAKTMNYQLPQNLFNSFIKVNKDIEEVKERRRKNELLEAQIQLMEAQAREDAKAETEAAEWKERIKKFLALPKAQFVEETTDSQIWASFVIAPLIGSESGTRTLDDKDLTKEVKEYYSMRLDDLAGKQWRMRLNDADFWTYLIDKDIKSE